MANELEKALYALIWDNPLLANMASSMSRITDPKILKGLPSFAAITARDGKVSMFINLEAFSLFDISGQKAVLSHEMQHILRDHIFRRGSRDPKMCNIAEDLSINCTLKHLSLVELETENIVKLQQIMDMQFNFIPGQIKTDDKGVTRYRMLMLPEDFGFNDNLSAEEYYELLKEAGYGKGGKKIKVTFIKGDGSQGQKEIDIDKLLNNQDVPELEELTKEGINTDLLKEELKSVVKKAVEKCQSEGQGNISAELQELINKLLTVKINWKSVLRNFIQNATRFFLKRTTKRPNKRFTDFILPSQKNDPKLSVLTILDGSGSVSDRESSEFFAQLDSMLTQGIEIDYVIGDSEIKMEPKKYTKNTKMEKTYGGTDENAWINFADKKDYDISIVLTDGEFYSTTQKPKKPMLWVITRKESFERIPKYLKKVLMEIKDGKY